MAEHKLITAKEIKDRNAAFNELKVKDKRIAIAKDVLASIKSRMIFPTHNKYFSPELKVKGVELYEIDGEKSIQELLLNKEMTCSVCAMGALFTSAIHLNNKFTVDEVEYMQDEEDDYIETRLEGIFSAKQLRLMECAFEGQSYMFEVISKQEQALGRYFHNKYNTPDDRMIAIMKNIIKNKGKFILK